MGAGAARRARAWLLSLRTLTVKALLFDFDGVLWDSEAAAFQSWQETYGEYGQHLPSMRLRPDSGPSAVSI
jgi:phosphoglycolate phosphatase-like HAD superfamily hydrolase